MTQASILVVEDEALIADDLEHTLKRLGYTVPAVVAEGALAIEATARHAPTIVLMDIKLRGRMDGIDAARVIRERFETPVIFLTSHSDSATLARASAVRPHGYVMKPFVERDLRVAVELCLYTHEVERALRARERWFSKTLNSISDAVITTDEALRVTFVNHAAEALLGRSVSTSVGLAIAEVCPLLNASGDFVPHPSNRALETCAAASTKGATLLRQNSGATLLVEDSASPIVDDQGILLGTVLILRDVTERRELQERVARTERLAALGTLAAGICHEISNPLCAVLSNVEFIIELGTTPSWPDDLRDCLANVHTAALHVADIVRSMRTFANISEAKSVRVRLQDVLNVSVKLTSTVVRNRARLVARFGDAPRVIGDQTRLTQVFVNLIVNAAQAIPVDSGRTHHITISLGTDDKGFAFVDIDDDGVGIPPEVLPKIFEPFFTTKSAGEGTGLGLSICRNIIDSMGGEISAKSRVGLGTTFTVRLPPAEEESAFSACVDPQASGESSSRRSVDGLSKNP